MIKKSFFITFFITFILTSAWAGMTIGFKWPAGTTSWQMFSDKANYGIRAGFVFKVVLSFIFGVIANIISLNNSKETT